MLRRRWQRLRGWWFLRRLAGLRLLRAFAAAYPEAVFVEIGANDGRKDDYLWRLLPGRRWTGVLVEPLPHVFETLRSNYEGVPGVRFENAAIAAADGTLPFFHVAGRSEGDPPWLDEIGSLSRATVLQHAGQVPELAERLVETDVPALTFESLCARHGLECVDLVVMDTEGHDGELVRAFPFARYRPRVLVYEHFHLPRAERAALRDRLAAEGYESFEEGLDTFALDTSPGDALTRRFRRLRPAAPAVAKEDE